MLDTSWGKLATQPAQRLCVPGRNSSNTVITVYSLWFTSVHLTIEKKIHSHHYIGCYNDLSHSFPKSWKHPQTAEFEGFQTTECCCLNLWILQRTESFAQGFLKDARVYPLCPLRTHETLEQFQWHKDTGWKRTKFNLKYRIHRITTIENVGCQVILYYFEKAGLEPK